MTINIDNLNKKIVAYILKERAHSTDYFTNMKFSANRK